MVHRIMFLIAHQPWFTTCDILDGLQPLFAMSTLGLNNLNHQMHTFFKLLFKLHNYITVHGTEHII
jgi:hypothetical protein